MPADSRLAVRWSFVAHPVSIMSNSRDGSSLFTFVTFMRSAICFEVHLPNLFHPASVLAQIPIAEAGRRTHVDDIVGNVKQEQPVINKAECSSELDPDRPFVRGDYSRVPTLLQYLPQLFNSCPGVASNLERFDTMAVVGLTGYAVGRSRARWQS